MSIVSGAAKEIVAVDREAERTGDERAVDVDLESLGRDDADALTEARREVRPGFPVARPTARGPEQRDRLVEPWPGDEDVDIAERSLGGVRIGVRATTGPSARWGIPRRSGDSYRPAVVRARGRPTASLRGARRARRAGRRSSAIRGGRRTARRPTARSRVTASRSICGARVVHRFGALADADARGSPAAATRATSSAIEVVTPSRPARGRSAGTSTTAPTRSSESIVPSAATTYAVGVPSPSNRS